MVSGPFRSCSSAVLSRCYACFAAPEEVPRQGLQDPGGLQQWAKVLPRCPGCLGRGGLHPHCGTEGTEPSIHPLHYCLRQGVKSDHHRMFLYKAKLMTSWSPSGSQPQTSRSSKAISSRTVGLTFIQGSANILLFPRLACCRLCRCCAVQGGYNAWFRIFDNKLGRRRNGEYAENYAHGADSCGIHASGAGFERSDRIETWGATPREFEEI